MPFQIADKPMVDRANRKACFFKMVSPSYFRTVGMTLKKGRGLSEHDMKGAPPVTVINETMARKHFPNEEPVGKRILVQEIVPGKTVLGPEIAWEVVGVVKDEKVGNLDDTRDNPGMYVTNTQSPVFFQSLVVRAGLDPRTLQQAIQKAVYEINKDQALTEMKTLEQIKTESMASNRLNSIMVGGFATVALLLAAIGIYGVISYSVVQRTHEIGIRAALGASTSDVLGLVLKHAMLMAGAGLLFGLLGALAINRLLTAVLFGVSPRDPVTMAAVCALLALTGLAASYVPARRAARVDPMICLRYE
jgi:putative ABC transport system permease protein